jgi:polysaccharide pyruvyl transferase WcaK-like protein
MHLHIGHHFFGAGNLGDDLMLAGFLRATQTQGAEVRLTCCIPWDRPAMRLRFPRVEWLPYDDTTRQQCIAECDAWLGLGDTPFQTSVGDWLLDHLVQEAQWCAAMGKRMFYLGVGVNDAAAARHAKTATLVRQATRIWTRDIQSAEWLRAFVPQGKVVIGSDLAHICLAGWKFAEVAAGEIGIVLNFEDPAQYTLPALDRLVVGLSEHFKPRWLAQEVRALTGSECALYPQLDQTARDNIPLVVPDYAHAPTARDLLAAWGDPGVMLTSRYHASLIGAWMGSRVVVFPRSEKVRSSALELRLSTVASIEDTPGVLAGVNSAKCVSRSLLERHAALALQSCEEAMLAMAKAGD